VRLLLAELQRATTDPQGDFLPSLVAGRHIRLEEVKPEVPVRRNLKGRDGGLEGG